MRNECNGLTTIYIMYLSKGEKKIISTSENSHSLDLYSTITGTMAITCGSGWMKENVSKHIFQSPFTFSFFKTK